MDSSNNYNLLSLFYHVILRIKIKVFIVTLAIKKISLFNGPFSYSEKESQSNDTLLHFVEFSNVHNCDRSSNATRLNLVYKNV